MIVKKNVKWVALHSLFVYLANHSVPFSKLTYLWAYILRNIIHLQSCLVILILLLISFYPHCQLFLANICTWFTLFQVFPRRENSALLQLHKWLSGHMRNVQAINYKNCDKGAGYPMSSRHTWYNNFRGIRVRKTNIFISERVTTVLSQKGRKKITQSFQTLYFRLLYLCCVI